MAPLLGGFSSSVFPYAGATDLGELPWGELGTSPEPGCKSPARAELGWQNGVGL